jgi:signal transduction histidine kinase
MPVLARHRSDIIDWGVAVVLGLFIWAASKHMAVDHGQRALDTFGNALVFIACASLGLRRRFPLTVVVVTTAALIAYQLRHYTGGPIYVTQIVALYSAASHYDRNRSLVIAGVSGAVLIVNGIATGGGSTVIHVLYAGWVLMVVFLADAARNRRAYFASVEERAKRAEEAREEEARRRVTEERLRIARDLHDVVAHAIASISVQSGVAAHVIDQHPEKARDALLAINQASKEAMAELRSTLGVLREEDENAPRRPAPGLSQLETLVGNATRAGLRVDVSIEGGTADIPPAVDVAAFRIVQESLTNVLRHAGATRAAIAVAHRPASVEVEVTDDGVGANGGSGTAVGGGGHGILGMRERAVSIGGCLEAGPRPSGGFRVWARLPLETATP